MGQCRQYKFWNLGSVIHEEGRQNIFVPSHQVNKMIGDEENEGE